MVKIGKFAAHLVAGEQRLRGRGCRLESGERALNAFKQRGAHGVDVSACGVLVGSVGCQRFDDGQVGLPPGCQLLHELGLALLHAGVLGDVVGDGALVLEGEGEISVGDLCLCLCLSFSLPFDRLRANGILRMASGEAALTQAGVVLPEVAQGVHLAHRRAAVQVVAHVVRLGRRGVVYVAADIAVAVFGLDLGHRHAAGVRGYVVPRPLSMDDFVDVFGAQVVLGFAFAVFAVRVDEEHVLALLRPHFVQYQDAAHGAHQTGRWRV